MKNYSASLRLFVFVSALLGLACGLSASSWADGVQRAASRKQVQVTRLRGLNGAQLVAIGQTGSSSSVTIKSGRARVDLPGTKARLYVVKDGEVKAVLGASKPAGVRGTVEAAAPSIGTVFLQAARVVGSRAVQGVILARGLSAAKFKKTVDPRILAALNKVRAGLKSKGLGKRAGTSTIGALAGTLGDRDKDGLHDVVDVDNDNDGITDNYDSSSNDLTAVTAGKPGFIVFSNLKMPLESSLNLHATGLDTTRIDAALQSAQTLAIGVAGDQNDPVRTAELDCTGLSYCSPGGTGSEIDNGTSRTFPDRNDKDKDGYGTITPGSTGDFQLQTGAAFADIGAGDVLTQILTDGVTGKESRVTAILNFIFVSTPALKSVTTSLATTVIDYSVVPVGGSAADCIPVSASGPVSLTIEGYRPQRPGVRSTGEGEWVDIGGSRVIVDIPNAPVVTPGSGAGAGPGNCRASAYSTSDPNLGLEPFGLRDKLSDRDASSANTFSFSIDLTDCLAGNPGGAIAWNSGEALFVDLQFRSEYGDNAAQKFCVRRQ